MGEMVSKNRLLIQKQISFCSHNWYETIHIFDPIKITMQVPMKLILGSYCYRYYRILWTVKKVKTFPLQVKEIQSGDAMLGIPFLL
jgi:hypothetical protein